MVAPNREGLVIASTVGRRSMISFANSVEPMKLQGERRHRGEDGGDSSTSQADLRSVHQVLKPQRQVVRRRLIQTSK
ncbi:unnamed protein product [Brassica oleracea]|uniref:(rape) hypothetical protein n=1 Tax=Brassica napus TaxID=3708 RepID=A0A816RKB7_BRANA|nr:unnamed protein product [Brassica napus]